jgi:hypothetical protein
MDEQPDWCCASRETILAWLHDHAPAMTDEELSWLPRQWQPKARVIRGAAAAVARNAQWARVEGENPRWELTGRRDANGILIEPGWICTDELIRTYGRRHLEAKILAGLPPLPERAWEVAS